jgi:bile acid:Na+ symporter, BASS family
VSVYKFIENKFWIFLLTGMVLGFLFPGQAVVLDCYVVLFLMMLLYIVFLKIDLGDVVEHKRNPFLIIYLLIFNLFVIPVMAYFLTTALDPDVRIGVILLACLPTGTAAPALTEIVKGKTSLTLVLTVLSSLIAPFTITALFHIFFDTEITLNYTRLFFGLITFTILPLIAAQLSKYVLNRYVDRCKKYLGPISVLLMMVIVMVVIGKEAHYIRSHLNEIIIILIVLYVMFFIFQVIGYFQAFWLKEEDRIALSVSKMAMNNVLGVIIALSYFSPQIVLIMVLSEVPWNTLPLLYSFSKKMNGR